MTRCIIQGHIIAEERLLKNYFLLIEDGIIHSIVRRDPGGHGERIDARRMFVLPGFRDQHIHDVFSQLSALEKTEEEMKRRFRFTCQALARGGTTGVYLATFGGPLEQIEAYCRGAKCWMDDPENGRCGAKLLGIHIEGTFINDECRGAQPAEYCLIPTRDDCLAALNHIHATGAARIANIVPDYGEASLAMMRHARRLGLLVGAGHTKADADQLRGAFERHGLQFMVHFTNGPIGQSFKPFGGGGTFEGALGLPIVKELIPDRLHVDERYLMDILKRMEERWGLDKIVAVTDASFPIAEEIPEGEFRIGSTIACADRENLCLRTMAFLQPDGTRTPAPPHTLCGSLLTMDRAFAHLLTLFTKDIRGHWFDHRAMPLDEAIIKAAKICSTHQAILDGSINETGSLAIGKKADIVIGSLENRDGELSFHVFKTLIDGYNLFDKNSFETDGSPADSRI
ncbi:MAG: hypothetical protein AB1656_27225 [Candidatus Omnitrophota bacterium]